MINIGVLGAGQLGRMMALAGYPLDFRLRFFDRAADTPASQVAPCMVADFEDCEALHRFASGLDLITYEFENVPAGAARELARRVPRFFPPPRALEIAQDRFQQKTFFQTLGIDAPVFAAIDSEADLNDALERTGLPAVLKTRRWGYDGKGQSVVNSTEDAARAWKRMGEPPLIAESFIRFERELSLVAARGGNGEAVFYPLTENHHREGILRWSLAPAPAIAEGLQAAAETCAMKIFEALEYAGVLTIEFFQAGGDLLANEMATRVHNSGHWTIEGAATSQFENHLRAIAGLPLGAASARGCAGMVNFIGSPPDLAAALAVPGARLHMYGKQPRAGRKLGHATVCAPSPADLVQPLNALRDLASCADGS